MRVLVVLMVFSFLSFKLNAQQLAGKPHATKSPLVVVDSFHTSMECLIIDPNKIESIDVFKDTAAVNRFGEAASIGVIIIHTKSKVNFLRLPALLDKYQIADSVRRYRVCINEVLIERPELILIDESEVDSVGTFVSADWNDLLHPKSENLFNITTKSRDQKPNGKRGN